MDNLFSPWGLFISAFVSATLAPGGSEAVLAFLVVSGKYSSENLLLIATFGNTLGSITTWLMGYWVGNRLTGEDQPNPSRQKALARVRRWGLPSLLLAWLPIVGDGFCFAAGWLRLPFLASVLAIAAGKAARYSAIILALGHGI